MNKNNLLQRSLLLVLILSPAIAFAATGGDNTFDDVVAFLKKNMGGSFGLMCVLLSFAGVLVALAGHAPMKMMFSTFGTVVAAHWGPAIAEKIFTDGATGDMSGFYMSNINVSVNFMILLACAALSVLVYQNHKFKTINADKK